MLGLFLILLLGLVSAANYYVNASGSDSNNGLTTATPFATIGKTASLSLNSGDIINVARGDTFRECFQIGSNHSNTVMQSYGDVTKSQPHIMGSINASASAYWTDLGSNIWISGTLVDLPDLIYLNDSLPTMTYTNWTVSSRASLSSQWQYYKNTTSSTILMYSVGNPATLTTGIEIPTYHRYSGSDSCIGVGLPSQTVVNITFLNIDVSHTQGQAVIFYADNSTWNDSNVQKTYAKSFEFETADYLTFCNNNLTDTGNKMIENAGQGEGIFFNNGVGDVFCNNHVIRNAGVAINGVHSTNPYIFDNIISNGTAGNARTTAGIYCEACTAPNVTRNNITRMPVCLEDNSEQVGWSSSLSSYTYNICVDDGMDLEMNSQSGTFGVINTVVSHNTFYHNGSYFTGSGLFTKRTFFDYVSGISFKNNIIVQANDSASTYFMQFNDTMMNSIYFNYNIWYAVNGNYRYNIHGVTKTSFNSYRSSINQESNSTAGNPTFQSNSLIPSSNSIACNAGNDGKTIGALECAPPDVVLTCEDNLTRGVPCVLTSSLTLTQDAVYQVNATSSSTGAITIGASNVILDCNGASINGNGTGYGLYNKGYQNITFNHCNIISYSTGILSQIWSTAYPSNLTINNTIIVNSTTHGMLISSTNYTIIDNVTSYGAIQQHGLYLDGMSTYGTGEIYPIVKNSRFYNNTKAGIQLNSGNRTQILYPLIWNNDIYGNGEQGINDLAGQQGNYSSNRIYNNGLRGISFSYNYASDWYPYKSNNNVIENNVIYGNLQDFEFANSTFSNIIKSNNLSGAGDIFYKNAWTGNINFTLLDNNANVYTINLYETTQTANVTFNYGIQKNITVVNSTITLNPIGLNYSAYYTSNNSVYANNFQTATITLNPNDALSVVISSASGGCDYPYEDFTPTSNVTFCYGTYQCNDSNANGCIIAGANGININCNGATLIGNFSTNSKAISRGSFYTDLIIQNCNIKNYPEGITFSGSNNRATILNNTINVTLRGINLAHALNDTIAFNTILGGSNTDSSYAGIRLYGSYTGLGFNNIYNNTINDFHTAIRIEGNISRNHIYNNSGYNNGQELVGGFGIYLTDFANLSVVEYNYIYNPDWNGIGGTASYNNFTNNFVYNASHHALDYFYGNNSLFLNNYGIWESSFTTGYLFYGINITLNTISNNIFTNIPEHGIKVEGDLTANNNITNNTIQLKSSSTLQCFSIFGDNILISNNNLLNCNGLSVIDGKSTAYLKNIYLNNIFSDSIINYKVRSLSQLNASISEGVNNFVLNITPINSILYFNSPIRKVLTVINNTIQFHNLTDSGYNCVNILNGTNMVFSGCGASYNEYNATINPQESYYVNSLNSNPSTIGGGYITPSSQYTVCNIDLDCISPNRCINGVCQIAPNVSNVSQLLSQLNETTGRDSIVNITKLNEIIKQNADSFKLYVDNTPFKGWFDRFSYNFTMWVKNNLNGQYWLVMAGAIIFIIISFYSVKWFSKSVRKPYRN